MFNVRTKEDTLKKFMKISALVYLITGIVFALFPNLLLKIINFAGNLFHMPVIPLSDGKVWLSLSFSMMMTITVLCFFVQDDVKRYGKFVIPLLIAKLSSSIAGLFYFKFVSLSFGYLLIFLGDAFLFLATLIIWVMAVKEDSKAISHTKSSSELSPYEKHFKTFMLVSAVAYFTVGMLFAFIPNHILNIVNTIGSAIGFPAAPLSDGKFWLTLAFSGMMTLTALCLFVYHNAADNKNYAVPIFVAKLSSAVAGLLYFIFSGWCFAYLAIFLVDGAIFAVTFFFYLRANEKWFIKHTAYLRKKPVPAKITPEATVIVEKGSDKFQLLKNVLEKTNFDSILNDYFEKSGKTKEEFSVVIKPNFMFSHHKKDISTFTDPELVEALINGIAQKGFTNISVVEAPSTYGNYYANREVLTVAKYLGYRTDKNYKIVDLSKEMVPHYYNFNKLGPELMLGHHFVGTTWKDADFRVSFAKNKTHCFCNYTLTLKNTYGVLPMQNKLKHYHTKRQYDWVTICSLADFPVHFGLIDAFYSGDGAFGVITCPHPKHTKTIIGGENLIAVDWVGATKMGLDPERPDIGRFLPLSIEAFGFPEKINWVGDKSTYDKWKKCPQFIVLFLDIIEELYSFSNWWFAVLSAQDKYFTFIVKSRSAKIARKILAPFKRFLFPYDAL